LETVEMSAPRNWARLPTPDPWGPSRAEDVAGRFQAWLYARLKERFVRGEIDAEQFAAELQRLFSKRAPSASVRAAMFAAPQASRRRRRLWASAAVAVAAAVGGVQASARGVQAPESGAARVMNTTAVATPLPVPRPPVPPAPPAYFPRVAGYRYTRSEGANLVSFPGGSGRAEQGFSVLVPKTREIWVAPDGSGRIREVAGEPIFLGERDRARWRAAGAPALVHVTNRDFGPGGLSTRDKDWARLPTHPGQLAAVIRQRATKPSGPPVDVEMFVIVGDLLRETAPPPALRAALHKVAAGIRGVEVVGSGTDRAGRRGVGVAMTTSHFGGRQRQTQVFDPATAALLAEERVLLERVGWVDAQPPAVIGYTTYVDSRVVPALP
jgi:hypothetical protein